MSSDSSIQQNTSNSSATTPRLSSVLNTSFVSNIGNDTTSTLKTINRTISPTRTSIRMMNTPYLTTSLQIYSSLFTTTSFYSSMRNSSPSAKKLSNDVINTQSMLTDTVTTSPHISSTPPSASSSPESSIFSWKSTTKKTEAVSTFAASMVTTSSRGKTSTTHTSYTPLLTSPTTDNNFTALSASKISEEIPSSLTEPISTSPAIENDSQTLFSIYSSPNQHSSPTGSFSSRVQTVQNSISLFSFPTSSWVSVSGIRDGVSTYSNTVLSLFQSTFTDQLNSSKLSSTTFTSMSGFGSNVRTSYLATSAISKVSTTIPSSSQNNESTFLFTSHSTVTLADSSSIHPTTSITSLPSVTGIHEKTSLSPTGNSFVIYSTSVKDSLPTSINFTQQYTSSNFLPKTTTLYQISPSLVAPMNSTISDLFSKPSTITEDLKQTTSTVIQTTNFRINSTLVHTTQFKPSSTLKEESMTPNTTSPASPTNKFESTVHLTSGFLSQVTMHPSLNISSTLKISPTRVSTTPYLSNPPHTNNHTAISPTLGSLNTSLLTTSFQVYSSTKSLYSSAINSSPLFTNLSTNGINNTSNVFMETVTSSLKISHTTPNVSSIQITSPTRISTTEYITRSTSINNQSYSSITASMAMESSSISSMFTSTLQRTPNITSFSMSSISNTTNTLMDSTQVVKSTQTGVNHFTMSANVTSIYAQNSVTSSSNIQQNLSSINNSTTQAVNSTATISPPIIASSTSGLVSILITSAVLNSTSTLTTSNSTSTLTTSNSTSALATSNLTISSSLSSTRTLNTSSLTTSTLHAYSSMRNSSISINITRHYTSNQISPSTVASVNYSTTEITTSKSPFAITQTTSFPINSTFVNTTQSKLSSTSYKENLTPNSTSKSSYLSNTTSSVAPPTNTFGSTVNLTSTSPSQVTMHLSLNVSSTPKPLSTRLSATVYLTDPIHTYNRTTISSSPGSAPVLNTSFLTTSSHVYTSNSTASVYSSVINSSPLFTELSTSAINNTLNVPMETITSSSNISYTPPSTSPSPESSNVSSISNITQTEADSTFVTSMTITSSMSIVVENSTVYSGSISTVTSLTARNNTTPYATLSTVLNITNTSVTAVISTRNMSSINKQPSAQSFTTINTTTLPVQSSESSTSLVNSTLVRIVPSRSTQTFTSVNVSVLSIFTNMTSTSLTLASVYSSNMLNHTPILLPRNSSSTNSISFPTTASPHTVSFNQTSELPRFNSSTVSRTSLTVSTIQTGIINSISPTFLPHQTVLPSTNSESKNYSITVNKSQTTSEPIRSSMFTNSTVSASKLSSHVIIPSSMKINRTNLTSVISSSLITPTNISTKAIQPTSVVSSVPVTSTVRIPTALSQQRIVSFNVTIVNRTYTSQLSNRSSKEYIEIAGEVKTAVSNTKRINNNKLLPFKEVIITTYCFGHIVDAGISKYSWICRC